jgi:hypothetical protein
MFIFQFTVVEFSYQPDRTLSRLQRGKYIEPYGRIGSKYEHVDRGNKQSGTLNQEIQAQRMCDKERTKRKTHVFYCQIDESKQNDEDNAILLVRRQ